jgi:hypothetical protein
MTLKMCADLPDEGPKPTFLVDCALVAVSMNFGPLVLTNIGPPSGV